MNNLTSLQCHQREELPIRTQNSLAHYLETMRWELTRFADEFRAFNPDEPIATKVVFPKSMAPVKQPKQSHNTNTKVLHSLEELSNIQLI